MIEIEDRSELRRLDDAVSQYLAAIANAEEAGLFETSSKGIDYGHRLFHLSSATLHIREWIDEYEIAGNDARTLLNQRLLRCTEAVSSWEPEIVSELSALSNSVEAKLSTTVVEGNTARKSSTGTRTTSAKTEYNSEAFKVADDYARCLEHGRPERQYLCRISYLIEIFRLVTSALSQMTKLVSLNK
jgi:hypothetical protein